MAKNDHQTALGPQAAERLALLPRRAGWPVQTTVDRVRPGFPTRQPLALQYSHDM